MKPTQKQLNDPVWWGDNAPDGYDYAFTTGPEWDGGESLVGDVRIANESGRTINGMLLVIGPSKWHKIAKRPTKPAFVPEVGVECEVKNRYEEEWAYIKIEGINKKTSNEGEYQVMGLDKNNNYCIYYSEDSLEFRPIKSERELLIEVILAHGNLSEGVLADGIMSAGFRLKESEK